MRKIDKINNITKENYTIEDTETNKNNYMIYSYSLNGRLQPWNDRYLGLKDYYNKCN